MSTASFWCQGSVSGGSRRWLTTLDGVWTWREGVNILINDNQGAKIIKNMTIKEFLLFWLQESLKVLLCLWKLQSKSSTHKNPVLTFFVRIMPRPGEEIPRAPIAGHRHQGLTPAHGLDVRAGKPEIQGVKQKHTSIDFFLMIDGWVGKRHTHRMTFLELLSDPVSVFEGVLVLILGLQFHNAVKLLPGRLCLKAGVSVQCSSYTEALKR